MGKTKRRDSDIDETKKATFNRHYAARQNEAPIEEKPEEPVSSDLS